MAKKHFSPGWVAQLVGVSSLKLKGLRVWSLVGVHTWVVG